MIDAKSGSVQPKKFRIWSAACSTGQEAYSIAMAFADVVSDFESWGPPDRRHGHLAVGGGARRARCVQRAGGQPWTDPEAPRRVFVHDPRGWRVNDALRRRCRFRVANLLKPIRDIGSFDIIFCRNVAIYFTPEDRKNLFLRLAKSLNRGGWLFTGSGESLVDLGPNWAPKQHCRAICYQPNGCNGVATLQR